MDNDNSGIETISPSDPTYEALVDTISSQRVRQYFDFNKLSEAYNRAEVGAVILVHYPSKVSNLHYAMKARGLARGEDYTVTKMTRDTNGEKLPAGSATYAINRLSPKMSAPAKLGKPSYPAK